MRVDPPRGLAWPRSPRALAVLLAVQLSLVYAPTSTGAVEPPHRGLIDRCDDGSPSVSLRLVSPGNATPCNLSLDVRATVEVAWVDMAVTGTSLNPAPGPFPPPATSFPTDPWLDVSGDGVREWSYNSTRFGSLGHTTVFSDGTYSARVSLAANGSTGLSFDVPSSAEIRAATLTLAGVPVPYWANQSELTGSRWDSTEEAPDLLAHGGLLWLAWSSDDPAFVSGGNDRDIVVRAYNGTAWSGTTDISPPPADDSADDRESVLVEYRGELWALWSHGWDNGTSGTTDLMYRRYNGSAWSAVGVISPSPTDGLNTYQNAAVHDGRLWIEWKTTDTSISAGNAPPGKDLDIVIRWYDGAIDAWGDTFELTDPANNFLDWISDIGSFDGKLYVVWEASSWDISSVYINRPPASDILMRAWDGTSWGAVSSLAEEIDNREGNLEDQSPRLAVYHNPVTVQDELYLFWMRGCLPTDGCTPDYDVVFRVFDGNAWGATQYLTDASDTDHDMFPCLADFSGELMAFWISGSETQTTQGSGVSLVTILGNVVFRAYDGEGWSHVEGNPGAGPADNASHPTCAVFDGRLFVAWEARTETPGGSEVWRMVSSEFEVGHRNVSVGYGAERWNSTSEASLGYYASTVLLSLPALQSQVGSNPQAADEWGNEMSRILLSVSSAAPASVTLNALDVRYDLKVRVNITGAFNDRIGSLNGSSNESGTVTIPLVLGIEGGAGVIALEGIHAEYRVDEEPQSPDTGNGSVKWTSPGLLLSLALAATYVAVVASTYRWWRRSGSRPPGPSGSQQGAAPSERER